MTSHSYAGDAATAVGAAFIAAEELMHSDALKRRVTCGATILGPAKTHADAASVRH